ncbi:hypothetical protein HY946_01160 [Candidatus Gottesmanbacteria bacterium]|nr:hypothetical protein [Candidatus Gottesmanbacteria bacterium]
MNNEEKILKPLAGVEPKISKPIPFIAGAVILGILSGVIIFTQIGNREVLSGGQKSTGGVSSTGVTVGSTNTKVFSDCTKGQLGKNDGKITTEGSHVLVRPGGVSQTVYLTSSVLDLDQFVGKQVEVCGQTFQGQTAGWLMDAGRVTLK